MVCQSSSLQEGLVHYCLFTCWISLLYLSPFNCILFRCTFSAQKCNLVLIANAGQFCSVSHKFLLMGVLDLPAAPWCSLSPGFRTSSGSDRDTSDWTTRVDCKAGTRELHPKLFKQMVSLNWHQPATLMLRFDLLHPEQPGLHSYHHA